MTERICAIILDYFGAEKTQQCVQSLVGQGLTTVYILDNSGSESAAEKLREALIPITAERTAPWPTNEAAFVPMP